MHPWIQKLRPWAMRIMVAVACVLTVAAFVGTTDDGSGSGWLRSGFAWMHTGVCTVVAVVTNSMLLAMDVSTRAGVAFWAYSICGSPTTLHMACVLSWILAAALTQFAWSWAAKTTRRFHREQKRRRRIRSELTSDVIRLPVTATDPHAPTRRFPGTLSAEMDLPSLIAVN